LHIVVFLTTHALQGPYEL